MRKFIFFIFSVLICYFAILNIVKAEVSASQYAKLHTTYLNALGTCTPTKVHIPGDCQEIGFTGQKVCDNGYIREVIGKEGTSCKVIDDGKKCYFPLSITRRLSNVGKNIAKSIESGELNISSSDPNIIWSEQMYNKYCNY